MNGAADLWALLIGFAGGAGVGVGVGGALCWLWHQERPVEGLQGLAARADRHGQQLLQIAATLRRTSPHTMTHGLWQEHAARELERIALAHVECINAISLESLREVSGEPVHLGSFRIRGAADSKEHQHAQ